MAAPDFVRRSWSEGGRLGSSGAYEMVGSCCVVGRVRFCCRVVYVETAVPDPEVCACYVWWTSIVWTIGLLACAVFDYVFFINMTMYGFRIRFLL